MDPTIRVVGAISLWAIEIIMQLRIYAIFDCSKKVSVWRIKTSSLSDKRCCIIGRCVQRSPFPSVYRMLYLDSGEERYRTSGENSGGNPTSASWLSCDQRGDCMGPVDPRSVQPFPECSLSADILAQQLSSKASSLGLCYTRRQTP